MDRIEQAVLECLSAVAPDADPASLAPDRPFHDQIEFDSVDFLNYVMKLERVLDVEIPEQDYPQLITLAGAVAYLAKATA